MHTNNNNNNKDDTAAVKTVIDNLKTNLENICQQFPGSSTLSKNEDGYYLPGKEVGFHRTLQHFYNLVLRGEAFLKEFGSYQNNESNQLKFVKNCFALYSAMKEDIAAIISKEIPFPPIDGEGDYCLAIELINALECLKNANRPFHFLLPLTKTKIFKAASVFSKNDLANAIENSKEELTQYQNKLIQYIAKSNYAKNYAKKMENLAHEQLIAMSEVIKEHKEFISNNPVTDFNSAKRLLDANKGAQNALNLFSLQYAELPDKLSFDNTLYITQLKANCDEQKECYLEYLKEQENTHQKNLAEYEKNQIEKVKKEYNEAINTLKPHENPILSSETALTEIDKIINGPTTETLVIANQSCEKEILTLETEIQELEKQKEDFEVKGNIDIFISSQDKSLHETLKEEFDFFYTQILSEFTTLISKAKQKLAVLFGKQTKINELKDAFLLHQLFAQLLQSIDGPNNVSLKRETIEKEMADSEKKIKRFNSNIKFLEKKQNENLEQINRLNPTKAKTESTITQHKLAIIDINNTLKGIENRETTDVLTPGLQKLEDRYAELKPIWWKTKEQKAEFAKLPELIANFKQALNEKASRPIELNKQLGEISNLLTIDEKDLRKIQKQLLKHEETYAAATHELTVYQKNLAAETAHFKELQKQLIRLNIANLIFELNNKLANAASAVADMDTKNDILCKELLANASSISHIIKGYNQSYALIAEPHFQDIPDLLTKIKKEMQPLGAEDDFYQSIAKLLNEKESELVKHQTSIQTISQKVRATADNAATELLKQLTALKDTFPKSLEKNIHNLNLFISAQRALLKKIQTGPYTLENLREDFYDEIEPAIENNIKQIGKFLEDIAEKLQTTDDIKNKDSLTLEADLNKLYYSTQTILDEHNKVKKIIKESYDKSREILLDQEKRTTLKEDYGTILDQYAKYRNDKYSFKDFFIKKDKIKRQLFIEKLKGALWEFEFINTPPTHLNKLIEQGVKEFKPGVFSNTKDPTKNLRGILNLLKADINEPLDYNVLRISKYLEIKSEQTQLDTPLQPITSPR